MLNTKCSYQLESSAQPENLIPKDTFTMVLQEVMIVESYFKVQQTNPYDFHETLPKALQPIFNKYNIDSTRFTSSMNYYTNQQETLKEIYNTIQDNITLSTAGHGVAPK